MNPSNQRLYSSVLGAIGHTPLVDLSRLVDASKGRILAKLEYFSPGHSKKDRIALAIIESAENRGELSSGQPVVEMTSGNTGTGVAIVCAVKKYPFVAVMSEGNSVERMRMMRALGAEVILVPQTSGGEAGEIKFSVRRIFASTSSLGHIVQFILSLTHSHRKLRTLAASIGIVLLLHGLPVVDAAIITSGDVSPGPGGAQPDPWNAGLLAVGLSSAGSLTIDNGSHVNSTLAYFAINDGSSAHLEMRGFGTSWTNSGQVTIGGGGTATAVIENGAVIDIGGTVVVGNSSPDNTVDIRTASGGQRATLRVQGNLYLGGDAGGPLRWRGHYHY